MPDWKELVRERMSGLKLPPNTKEEVIAELAAHLEDCRDVEGSESKTEEQVSGIRWRALAQRVQATRKHRGMMNNRKKTLWLPTFANLLILTLEIQALFCFGIHPRIALGRHVWFSFPLPWLLALLISGATGALLAKTQGGSSPERLVAGLAPWLVWLGEFCVMALAFSFDGRDFAGFPMSDFGLTALWWVVFPGMALFLGTLPFVARPATQA